MSDDGSGPCINLDAPETIRDLSVLTEDQLARAAELLKRELEAPQTPTCRRLKRVTLRRIELRLGRRGTVRRLPAPRPLRRPARPLPRHELTPARALDAFLSTLDGWNLDWTDPAEVERVGVPRYGPERALGVLIRAYAAGLLARPAPDIEPETTPVEQLVLPIREAA